jgi:hypothetical protein
MTMLPGEMLTAALEIVDFRMLIADCWLDACTNPDDQQSRLRSACGHTEPRRCESEATYRRQFALGVGPQRQ